MSRMLEGNVAMVTGQPMPANRERGGRNQMDQIRPLNLPSPWPFP